MDLEAFRADLLIGATSRVWHHPGMTERVTLRPASEDDLAVLLKLTQDPEATGEYAWAGWFDQRTWRRRWDEDGLIGREGGTLMVIRDDEPVGMVSWQRRGTGPVSYCWEMGIGLLPEARGRGYGTEAHRLLVRYLFAHTPVYRIEAVTEVGNIAEQKALENAGFTRDGVLRGRSWRDGAWRDDVLYSILRTDPRV
jgi:RimJ/RimL family protein N-acetyltransferase